MLKFPRNILNFTLFRLEAANGAKQIIINEGGYPLDNSPKFDYTTDSQMMD